jgi:hypothetical protein
MVLDLANEAESFKFMTSIPVHEQLKEIWIEKLLPIFIDRFFKTKTPRDIKINSKSF